jgi:hypothetical protein
MTDIDLNFLARQNERILTEMGSLRDEMRVLSAMVLRVDSSVQAMTQELHAIYIWMGRMDSRVRNLEDQPER